MSYKGYGDGTKWDPAWTNDKQAIEKLVDGYYGCLVYGGDPRKCEGPFNYADDVSTSIQNCQPAPTAPNPPTTPGLTGITSNADQIIPLLYQTNPNRVCVRGQADYDDCINDKLFHNKKDEPGVYYWCTFLVVDAYNKAGFAGLGRTDHGGVLRMKSFFANNPGYQLLPPNTPVEQLRHGDAIFFEGNLDQHVSLIKLIDVSPAGRGAIKTYEANNVVTEDVVSVENHKATVAQTTAHKFTLTGFGQVKGQ